MTSATAVTIDPYDKEPKTMRQHAGKLLPTFVLLAGLGLWPAVPWAASNDVVPVPGMGYRVDLPLLENLRALKGKQVTLYLASGTQLSGRLREVHRQLVHLERVRQREFMDALIRTDRIEAVEAQFRAYERDLERLQK